MVEQGEIGHVVMLLQMTSVVKCKTHLHISVNLEMFSCLQTERRIIRNLFGLVVFNICGLILFISCILCVFTDVALPKYPHSLSHHINICS